MKDNLNSAKTPHGKPAGAGHMDEIRSFFFFLNMIFFR